MSDYKRIAGLEVVTDTENSYDQIGDIEINMFDEIWLKNHIKSYGVHQLLEALARLQSHVICVKNTIDREISESGSIDSIGQYHNCPTCGGSGLLNGKTKAGCDIPCTICNGTGKVKN